MTTFDELKRKSAWPPTSNGMPDLGNDYPDTLLWQYFTAPESLDGDLHSLAVNLARLSDKAIREYRAANDDLTAFLGTPRGVERLQGHTRLLQATDHLENCIDAIRRAESFFNTLAFQRITTEENQEMLKELHRPYRRDCARLPGRLQLRSVRFEAVVLALSRRPAVPESAVSGTAATCPAREGEPVQETSPVPARHSGSSRTESGTTGW